MTTIGLAGSGEIAAYVSRQLANKYSVRILDLGNGSLCCDGAAEVENATHLAEGADILVLCTDSDEARDVLLRSTEWLKGSTERERIVIDMGQSDPDDARSRAENLRELGITLVDAPLHTENTATAPETSAIFFGGPSSVLASTREILENVCPTIIHCGDAGSGHAMRLVVAAIAACNRLITYECAAMGARNGLTIGDMATVLNKSSGYNSASARVLPAMTANKRTANVTLGAWADDLRKASSVAMRLGAPMLIATMARSTLDAASNRLGESATVDRLAEIWEIDSGLPASKAG
ncbi:NAD-binding protein [Paraburkholderia phymatum]|uniref:6-phosphogluconate dehydrogenase NAD-binding n=1 Tax=Paraburkholderia phymatum (strain DSM 17167 / CIP 108236 / LMG 21445 / STM815) TaxID=391038 RepID=B2JTE7_PARP8|nr:NAD-binding protein [Paraburkholderia phymatum]ACC75850.1 6-phosphogluconate dehydrogenase NAD-binding [Paraburkholderia phymatum STM815]